MTNQVLSTPELALWKIFETTTTTTAAAAAVVVSAMMVLITLT